MRTARTRTRISAVSPAETVPTIIIVERTPSNDIRYGETTLYETGCMPPYQARLYAVPGCRPKNSAQASCAAMSPPLLAKKRNRQDVGDGRGRRGDGDGVAQQPPGQGRGRLGGGGARGRFR
ncbi:hypothetical protein SMICM17S_07440 [Streptomyces microflavus]